MPDREINTEEIWKPIPGFPAYEASTLGRIRSIDRALKMGPNSWQPNGYVRHMRGIILKSSLSTSGYPHVTLARLGKLHGRFVHSLVLLAFIGPCPAGMECCHRNDAKTDNCLANLRWDTPKANGADQIRNGHSHRGEKHGQSKLTENDVIAMRKMRNEKTHREIAEIFGICRENVSMILRRATWKHV